MAAAISAGLGLFPLALVFGALGWRRTKANGTRGGALALIALVVGAVELLGAVVLAVVLVRAVQAAQLLPADVASARNAHVAQLVVGNCLDQPLPQSVVDTVRVVPCSQPHAAQVIVRDSLGQPGDPWPGQGRADEQVATWCRAAAPDLVADGRLISLAPTSEGWAKADRIGLCLALTDAG